MILWRSGWEFQMGKLRQLLTVICPPYNNGGVLLFKFLFYYYFAEKIRHGLSYEPSALQMIHMRF